MGNIFTMAESIVNVISGSPETEKTNEREKQTLERGQKIFDEISKHEQRLKELEFGPIAQLTPLVIPFIACFTVLMLMGICCCGLYCFLGEAETIGRVTRRFRSRPHQGSQTQVEDLEMGQRDRNCDEIVSRQGGVPIAGTGGL